MGPTGQDCCVWLAMQRLCCITLPRSGGRPSGAAGGLHLARLHDNLLGAGQAGTAGWGGSQQAGKQAGAAAAAVQSSLASSSCPLGVALSPPTAAGSSCPWLIPCLDAALGLVVENTIRLRSLLQRRPVPAQGGGGAQQRRWAGAGQHGTRGWWPAAIQRQREGWRHRAARAVPLRSHVITNDGSSLPS